MGTPRGDSQEKSTYQREGFLTLFDFAVHTPKLQPPFWIIPAIKKDYHFRTKCDNVIVKNKGAPFFIAPGFFTVITIDLGVKTTIYEGLKLFHE